MELEKLHDKVLKKTRKLVASGDFFKNLPIYSKSAELAIVTKCAIRESEIFACDRLYDFWKSQLTKQRNDMKAIIGKQGNALLKHVLNDPEVAYLGEEYFVRVGLSKYLLRIKRLEEEIAGLSKNQATDTEMKEKESLQREEAEIKRLRNHIKILEEQLIKLESEQATTEEDLDAVWASIKQISLKNHRIFAALGECAFPTE